MKTTPVLFVLATAACSPAPRAHAGLPKSPAVTGNVTYLEHVPLPRASVVKVQLLDLSSGDGPAPVIGEQAITTTGQGVPIPFSVPYDASKINANRSYSLSARIDIDGKLAWITTETQPVITLGNPITRDIIVAPVNSLAPAP